MLRLTATDPSIALSERQAQRVQYLLLQFIPATSCHVERGPGVVVLVPNHGLDELASGIRADIEAIIGSPVSADELAD